MFCTKFYGHKKIFNLGMQNKRFDPLDDQIREWQTNCLHLDPYFDCCSYHILNQTFNFFLKTCRLKCHWSHDLPMAKLILIEFYLSFTSINALIFNTLDGSLKFFDSFEYIIESFSARWNYST